MVLDCVYEYVRLKDSTFFSKSDTASEVRHAELHIRLSLKKRNAIRTTIIRATIGWIFNHKYTTGHEWGIVLFEALIKKFW